MSLVLEFKGRKQLRRPHATGRCRDGRRDGGVRAGERAHAKGTAACARANARMRQSEAEQRGAHARAQTHARNGACAGLIGDEAISVHARDLYLEDRNDQATHRAHLSHRCPRFASCFCEALEGLPPRGPCSGRAGHARNGQRRGCLKIRTRASGQAKRCSDAHATAKPRARGHARG